MVLVPNIGILASLITLHFHSAALTVETVGCAETGHAIRQATGGVQPARAARAPEPQVHGGCKDGTGLSPPGRGTGALA